MKPRARLFQQLRQFVSQSLQQRFLQTRCSGVRQTRERAQHIRQRRHLTQDMQTIANLGYESVVFERALYPGDSLYAESEVLEKREAASKPDRGIVSIETRGFNQDRERIVVLRRGFLAPKRGPL